MIKTEAYSENSLSRTDHVSGSDHNKSPSKQVKDNGYKDKAIEISWIIVCT